MSQPIDPPRGDGMPDFEGRLQAAAGRFDYPPTPDIAGRVRARLEGARPGRTSHSFGMRFAQAALIVLVILAALMAVPGVRAAVLEFFRVGAVKIFLAPTPTSGGPAPASGGPAPTSGGPAATATPIEESGIQAPATATPASQPSSTPTPYRSQSEPPAQTFSLDDLDGETTLEDVRGRAGFPVLLPTYPPDLGAPDRVYLQYFGGNIVIMVWMQPQQPDQVRMSLHALAPGVNAFKMEPRMITELEVNGAYAIWAEGPYMLIYRGDGDAGRLIDGHVLIWTVGDVTYRLEIDQALTDAVTIAESLR